VRHQLCVPNHAHLCGGGDEEGGPRDGRVGGVARTRARVRYDAGAAEQGAGVRDTPASERSGASTAP
jgi:hypothetical protein